MSPLSIAAILLAASMAVLGGPSYRVAPSIEISRPEENNNSHLGKVNGLRSCGGKGRVVQWRIDGCSGEGTCQLPGDGQPRQSALEFVPSEDIDALGIKFILIRDGEAQTVYERPVSDSSVQGGETYVVNGAGAPGEELRGQTVTTQYILYRVDSGDVEICTEADFKIV